MADVVQKIDELVANARKAADIMPAAFLQKNFSYLIIKGR